MEYGNLVRRAWRLTWRNRFLWVLGLFAPSTVVSCSGSGGSGRSFDFDTRSGAPSQLPPELSRLFEQVVVWVGQHLALIILGVAVALALGLLLLIVSLIAQGGIARA